MIKIIFINIIILIIITLRDTLTTDERSIGENLLLLFIYIIIGFIYYIDSC